MGCEIQKLRSMLSTFQFPPWRTFVTSSRESVMGNLVTTSTWRLPSVPMLILSLVEMVMRNAGFPTALEGRSSSLPTNQVHVPEDWPSLVLLNGS